MGRILVVEDEHHIRLLITSILFQLGHQVKEAPNGMAALQTMKTFIPDLLVTDLKMPVMNGIELIDVVNRAYPDLLIGTISAYSDHLPKQLRQEIKFNLKKPFARSQLVEAVNQFVH
jgi:CheY-like chemotaxis protein